MTRPAVLAPDAPTRPALRYSGSKWRLAAWIVRQFPPHVCYVEPYGGSGAVLLRKRRSIAEVYNDKDGEVVNFFRVLRTRGGELLEALRLTPFSRLELDIAYEPTDDPFEAARRLYVRCWQSRSGARTQWRSGWRHCRGTNRRQTASQDWADLGHLAAVIDRLTGVQIEHSEAQAILGRFDAASTLFYVDPPYVPETRSERWRTKAYKCEMTTDDHVHLLAALRGLEGMVVLSGYDSELYHEALEGWSVTRKRSRCDVGYRTEVLWCSPAAVYRHRQLMIPMHAEVRPD
jgi:DNA adenine methylase